MVVCFEQLWGALGYKREVQEAVEALTPEEIKCLYLQWEGASEKERTRIKIICKLSGVNPLKLNLDDV